MVSSVIVAVGLATAWQLTQRRHRFSQTNNIKNRHHAGSKLQTKKSQHGDTKKRKEKSNTKDPNDYDNYNANNLCLLSLVTSYLWNFHALICGNSWYDFSLPIDT